MSNVVQRKEPGLREAFRKPPARRNSTPLALPSWRYFLMHLKQTTGCRGSPMAWVVPPPS